MPNALSMDILAALVCDPMAGYLYASCMDPMVNFVFVIVFVRLVGFCIDHPSSKLDNFRRLDESVCAHVQK
ncbi:hypothetical protein FVE85_2133 [Porphyridium purpureum]|uniref:Uncharacterized protein n=1 Tax=Porphyridium purpureum TaxID=35688 RepID=A0A5J4YXX1_PORPP|nr:hypothetical protein FVE85_2133 [Porphyridium purpureum]|eukprot:POR4951..scf209_3